MKSFSKVKSFSKKMKRLYHPIINFIIFLEFSCFSVIFRKLSFSGINEIIVTTVTFVPPSEDFAPQNF